MKRWVPVAACFSAVLRGDPFLLEETPWLPTPLEWRAQAQGLGLWYHSLNHSCHRSLAGIALSLEGAFSDSVAAEALLAVAKPSLASWRWDSFALKGRYLFMNSLLGDPFNFSGEALISIASQQAVHNEGEFFPGTVNFELQGAVGKEWLFQTMGSLQAWVLLGLGQANTGSPWGRGELGLQATLQEVHFLKVFFQELVTTGAKGLFCEPFPGYAHWRASWGDLYGQYTYAHPIWGEFRFSVGHRVQAWRAPSPWNLAVFTWTYLISF